MNHKPTYFPGKLSLAGLAFASLALTSGAKADTVLPITVTSGFNQDVIANGGSASGSTTAGIDGTFTTFYDSTWATAVYPGDTGVAAGAIPAGTVTGASGSVYSLAPAIGDNALVMSNQNETDFSPPLAASGTLFLSETGASTLYVLGTSGNGASIVDYTLNFAGGATQSGSLTFADWGTGGGEISGLGRLTIAQNTYDDVHDNIFNLYTAPITVDPTDSALTLDNITFTYDSTDSPQNAVASIFAVSAAVAVPEPSTWAMMLVGLSMLILVARRTRSSAR